MLVAVQIPIVDLRAFTTVAGRLPLPGWPGPEPDREFLRSFGVVRRRPSGGINGWLGEASICDVEKGLCFAGPLPRRFNAGNCDWSLRVVYRRFYADGIATSKFEIGFDVRPVAHGSVAPKLATALDFLLGTSMAVPHNDPVPLARLGGALAKAYLSATTSHSAKAIQDRHPVLPGRPCIVIEHTGRSMALPRIGRTLPTSSSEGTQSVFWYQRRSGDEIPVWFLHAGAKVDDETFRHLRIYILRLHAETESIVKVLRSISTGLVAPAERSRESDRLQKFLMSAFRHQRKAEKKLNAVDPSFYEQAIAYRYDALPGYYDELLRKIESINPRGTVKTAIENYLSNGQNSGLIVMGDMVMTKNEVENSGSIGVIGEAHQSTVNTSQMVAPAKFAEEAKALDTLAAHLKKSATTPDEEIEADAVKKASEKFSQGDEPRALAWLKRTGKWALEVAEEMSVKVAADLITKATTGL